MRRIIIENRSTMPDAQVVCAIASVIESGRISNNGKQYSYLTTFASGLIVYSDLNKQSDKFVAYEVEKE